MKSHTRQHQLRAPFMLYQTMIYPTLNSLFPLIGHKGEHSRAAHFRSLHAHSSVVTEISLAREHKHTEQKSLLRWSSLPS